VRVINDQILPNQTFPRNFEPIAPNLGDITREIQDNGADVGFAHDCDADRVALVSEEGQVYPEDIILALIAKDTLEQLQLAGKTGIIVTNVASSLSFDDLAREFSGRVVRTPVGERNLASVMNDLLLQLPDNEEIFGGEGSSGGYMLPRINNARDGILAAAKIVEILCRRKQPLSTLVNELPQYQTTRETLQCPIEVSYSLMSQLKESLRAEGVEFGEIDRDVRVIAPQEWVLVHPSNTEPIIRVISEAKTTERAKELCTNYMQKLIELK
jgi:phosphomannomutase